MTATTRLVARQCSPFSGYRYAVTDEVSNPIGEITWPELAQAKNARLRWHGPDDSSGRPLIRVDSAVWSIPFEYLDRGWVNDVQYLLMSPAGTCAATAEMRFSSTTLTAGVLKLTAPIDATFVRARRWPKQRIDLVDDGLTIGSIADRRLISLTRELNADLPATLALPTQLFIVFLACHLIQTQA